MRVEASDYFARQCQIHEERLWEKYGAKYSSDRILAAAVNLADLDVSRKYGRNLKEIMTEG